MGGVIFRVVASNFPWATVFVFLIELTRQPFTIWISKIACLARGGGVGMEARETLFALVALADGLAALSSRGRSLRFTHASNSSPDDS